MKYLILVLVLFPVMVFGGKEEREYKNKELVPAIKAAEAVYKQSCGCALKVDIDDKTLKSKEEMGLAKHVAESVAEGAPKYCTDDASKSAVCKMKTLEIKKTTTTEFKFEGSRGVASVDGTSYPSWDMMTPQLDK